MKYTLPELRAKFGLTQKEVADKVGVSVQTYNAWEQDFGKINMRNGNKLCKVFGVTLDDIFFTN